MGRTLSTSRACRGRAVLCCLFLLFLAVAAVADEPQPTHATISNPLADGSVTSIVQMPPTLDLLSLPALENRMRRTYTVSMSTIYPGVVLLLGGLLFNWDQIAVAWTSSYGDYVAMKYATLGAAAAGLSLVSLGTVLLLFG